MISKIIILTVLCTVVNVLANPKGHGGGGGHFKKAIKNAAEKCKGESTPEEIQKSKTEKNFPDSMNCYVGCMGIEMKWLTADGAYNAENAKESVEKCPEQFKAKVQGFMDKLKAAVGDTTGKCESGTKLLPIANEMMKKHKGGEGDEPADE